MHENRNRTFDFSTISLLYTIVRQIRKIQRTLFTLVKKRDSESYLIGKRPFHLRTRPGCSMRIHCPRLSDKFALQTLSTRGKKKKLEERKRVKGEREKDRINPGFLVGLSYPSFQVNTLTPSAQIKSQNGFSSLTFDLIIIISHSLSR